MGPLPFGIPGTGFMYEYLERFQHKVSPTPLPGLNRVKLTAGDTGLAALPACPGVYRFFDAEANLLYIGKSIDICTRVKSHYAEARKSQREQRMLQGVVRIDCQPTAGELGALLLENQAIKHEQPLYNRRQRQIRRMWTVKLGANKGYLQPEILEFPSTGRRDFDVFGLYSSRRAAQRALAQLAKEEMLCLAVLGLEKGRSPCFQFQLGRCGGACAGQEPPESHDGRLMGALASHRLLAWPHSQAILIHETAAGETHSLQPQRQWHLIDDWVYLGSFQNLELLPSRVVRPEAASFDRDAYRIISRYLRTGKTKVLSSETKTEIQLVPEPAYSVSPSRTGLSNQPRGYSL